MAGRAPSVGGKSQGSSFATARGFQGLDHSYRGRLTSFADTEVTYELDKDDVIAPWELCRSTEFIHGDLYGDEAHGSEEMYAEYDIQGSSPFIRGKVQMKDGDVYSLIDPYCGVSPMSMLESMHGVVVEDKTVGYHAPRFAVGATRSDGFCFQITQRSKTDIDTFECTVVLPKGVHPECEYKPHKDFFEALDNLRKLRGMAHIANAIRCYVQEYEGGDVGTTSGRISVFREVLGTGDKDKLPIHVHHQMAKIAFNDSAEVKHLAPAGSLQPQHYSANNAKATHVVVLFIVKAWSNPEIEKCPPVDIFFALVIRQNGPSFMVSANGARMLKLD